MNITFIGTGYVGLVYGIMLSSIGHNIKCMDIDKEKILKLKSGILPIYEKDLEKYLLIGIKNNQLHFNDSYKDLHKENLIFITVGTPTLDSGECNLNYIYSVIDSIKYLVNKNCVIVIKSTVPPGTASKIESYLRKDNLFISIVSNPEFLREGTAVHDFLNQDRIIVGSSSVVAMDLVLQVYHSMIIEKQIPVVRTDSNTAELIKYASNSFLAIKIAFINEISNLSEKVGGNMQDISLGIGLDKRIGLSNLNVSPGFGGSCFPKDLLALSNFALNNSVKSFIIDATIYANNTRIIDMVNKIISILNINFNYNISNKSLAILGVTYKANTDDIRNSPAIGIIKGLLSYKLNISVYDPVGIDKLKNLMYNLNYADSILNACKNSDAIIILTEWENFKKFDFRKIFLSIKTPIIIDLRNILDHKLLTKIGYNYYSLGYKHE